MFKKKLKGNHGEKAQNAMHDTNDESHQNKIIYGA